MGLYIFKMAENKKSVLLYCDIFHTVKELSNEEAGRLFKHYLMYINDMNPTSDDRLTVLLFEPIKQQLKRDLKVWESKCERNKEIAIASWEKRKDTNAYERIRMNTKNTDKDTVTDKDIINKYDFVKSMCDYGFSQPLILEWLKVRKTKKATNTETAFKKFIAQVELTKLDKNEVLEKCIEKSWSGFNAEWMKNEINFKPQKHVVSNNDDGIL